MKKLLFLLLALGSLQSFGQVSKTEVNNLIDSKLTNSVRPSDIKAVTKRLSDFANQGDSTAKTKESFIIPGSSGSYLNGLKQWIPFPDLSVYATTAYVLGGYSPLGHTHGWSVITGKPTTVATSGITDAVSLAGAQALSNKTGNISQWTNNAGYLTGITSGLVTTALGYTPVNPASTPSLVPVGNDTQVLGGALNYYSNGYIRQLNFNSTAFMSGATNGRIAFTGTFKGPNVELTGAYKNQLTIGSAGNGGWLTLNNGASGLSSAGFGFNGITDTELQINNDEGGLVVRGPDGQARFDGAGGLILGSTTASGYKLDVYGTSNFRGNVSIAAGSNISGGGSGLTGIPYSTGITDKPFIPTNVDYVDMSTNQDINGSKTYNNAANFVNSWIGYQAIFGKTYNNAARIGFRDGTGIISGVVGYGSATSAGEFQFRAGSQSAFVNAGNSSLTMFSDGNILAQTGGTAVNAGYKMDIVGTARVSGDVNINANVIPQTDGVSDMGSSSKRMDEVFARSVLSSNFIGTVGATTYGTNNTALNIDVRSGTASQIVGGYHPSGNAFFQSRGVRSDDNTAGLQALHDITATGGKAWGQTFTPILRASANNDELIGTVIAPSLQPGAFTNVKMYALRVGGDIKLDGGIEFASWLVPQADNLYDIGSGVNRVRSLFTSSAIANNFTGTKGATTFGVNNSSYNIDFRQGSTTQFVAGFHPSGNMYIQPRGVRPSDSGEGLQVTGSSLFAGEFKTTIGTAGLKTSNVLGLDFITLHHANDTPSLSNFVLGMSQSTSATFIGSVGSVATYINGSQKLKVSSAETSVHNLLRIAAAPEFADNAAAISGGMTSGQIYRTGDLLKIVH